MFIKLAGSSASETGSSEDDDSRDGKEEFVMASVTGAIYLLMVSTSNDLRAGFSLLVDGSRAGHRVFGFGLLTLYFIMIWSAVTVIISTSDDSASVLLNAVAVLFIADLDEKALKFFSTIPSSWRIFWAMEFIGISFSLALVAVSSIGESSQLLEDNGSSLQGYPSWMLWVLNPMVVTVCSYILSAGLNKLFESCRASLEPNPLTLRSTVTWAFSGSLAYIQALKDALRREPVFYVALGVWLVHGVWTEFYYWFAVGKTTSSINFFLCLGSGTSVKYCIQEIGGTYTYIINAILVAGIVLMTLGRCLPEHEGIVALEGPLRSSDQIEDMSISRLPSLMVGLGVGYWVAAILVVLGSFSFEGGGDVATTAASVIGYIIVPCFVLVGIVMVADTTVFGVKFAAFIKPFVEILLNRRKIVYWIMMAVFRDAVLLWAIVTILIATEDS